MKTVLVSLAVLAFGSAAAAAQTFGSGIGSSNASNCMKKDLQIGESPPLATPSGSLPTARGKKPGEMAGIPGGGSQADGSTVVIGPNGDCTIYRYEERAKNPSR